MKQVKYHLNKRTHYLVFWLQRLNPDWLSIHNSSRFLRLFYFLFILKLIIGLMSMDNLL